MNFVSDVVALRRSAKNAAYVVMSRASEGLTKKEEAFLKVVLEGTKTGIFMSEEDFWCYALLFNLYRPWSHGLSMSEEFALQDWRESKGSLSLMYGAHHIPEDELLEYLSRDDVFPSENLPHQPDDLRDLLENPLVSSKVREAAQTRLKIMSGESYLPI